MSEESIEERQNCELAVLRSIYEDAVVDNREHTAWNMWKPLDLLIKLLPHRESNATEVHCSVTLRFECCHLYPEKAPIITVHNLEGLSSENANKLLSELQELASQKCGEVMIYELTQHTKLFLDDHNEPRLSFYDEMLKQKEEQKKKKQDEKEIEYDKNLKKRNEELERRNKLFDDSKYNRKTSLSQDNNEDGEEADEEDGPELICYADESISTVKRAFRAKGDDICTCNVRGAKIFKISQRNNKKMYISNCIGHSSTGATTYIAIDESTGDRFVAKKWSLPPTANYQTRTQQLDKFQHDLRLISKLKEPSLVPYIAMEMPKEANKRAGKRFYIFRQFILGCSLQQVLQFRTKICGLREKYDALRLLRHVAIGLYSALKELHSNGMLHRDVRSENIFLDNTGAVRVVGASLDSRAMEMVEGDSFCDGQTKPHDIYTSAQLLLSIVCTDSVYQEIPQDLPGSAKDFLSRCLTEEEYSQWTAEQLLNHSFLVDSPRIQPTTKNGVDNGSEDEDEAKTNLINTGSRLTMEFEVIKLIGRGGFGDVLKVKNKLDGRFYAIKRVKLNPKNEKLFNKMIAEARLLSCLNHDNVVRYYTAWIDEIPVRPGDSESDTESYRNNQKPKKSKNTLEEDIAKLGGNVQVEWTLPETSMMTDDDDEDCAWYSSKREESSDVVEFEGDTEDNSDTIPSEESDSPRPQSALEKNVLMIQMEFCEKNTIRQAIDNGLCQEHHRAWRLFREIVEGLAHVHHRGMIHRDLKPANIFLDLYDHVKIGDFGLATYIATNAGDNVRQSQEMGGSLTGQIGTTLYVAPEILQSAGKVSYNQKVDLYSIGIILFEMFYPFQTGTERIKVIEEIRTEEVIIPEDFVKDEYSMQIRVLKWLLDHDPSVRPTCSDLLASEHVPRPRSKFEVQGLLSHTLHNRDSRDYQRLVAACLDQKQSPAEDLTYHKEMQTRPNELLAAIKNAVIRVFRSHGASEFSPPILTPRAKGWDQSMKAVKLMTSSGSVCYLPHDLRLPFARHTAYTGVKYMRRYIVDRVFREKQAKGFHPREITECAFDIVTPGTESLWSDAELLVVASRAASESTLKVTLQLNHTELLRALLLSCGVPQDKHADVYPVLVDISFGRITTLQLETHLTSLCIPEDAVHKLQSLMETDVGVNELRDWINNQVKHAKWSKVALHACTELETLYRNAKALGCECPVTVAPFLAYNAKQHCGVFWQMYVIRSDQKPNVKHRYGSLIAAGGRYNAVVEEFWKIAREKESDELMSCSVGFSMCLDRMAAILKKIQTGIPPALTNVESTLICVCLWGNAGSGKEHALAAKRANTIKDLWSAGYNCCSWPVNCDPHELHEVTGAGIVIQDEGGVRATCWTGDRVRGQKVVDVLDFVKQTLNPEVVRSPEGNVSRSTSWTDNEKSNCPNTTVIFITANDRMSKPKRVYENQINTKLTSQLVALGLQPVLGRVRVSVLALACGADAVRALAARLDAPLHARDLPDAFEAVAKHFDKNKKILDEALDELINLANSNQNRPSDETQLYALYSIKDSLLRLIT